MRYYAVKYKTAQNSDMLLLLATGVGSSAQPK